MTKNRKAYATCEKVAEELIDLSNWTRKDMVEAIRAVYPDCPNGSISSSVHQLKAKGIIIAVGRGVYKTVAKDDRSPLTKTSKIAGTKKKKASAVTTGLRPAEVGQTIIEYVNELKEALAVSRMETKKANDLRVKQIDEKIETIKHLNQRIREHEKKASSSVKVGQAGLSLDPIGTIGESAKFTSIGPQNGGR